MDDAKELEMPYRLVLIDEVGATDKAVLLDPQIVILDYGCYNVTKAPYTDFSSLLSYKWSKLTKFNRYGDKCLSLSVPRIMPDSKKTQKQRFRKVKTLILLRSNLPYGRKLPGTLQKNIRMYFLSRVFLRPD